LLVRAPLMIVVAIALSSSCAERVSRVVNDDA